MRYCPFALEEMDCHKPPGALVRRQFSPLSVER